MLLVRRDTAAFLALVAALICLASAQIPYWASNCPTTTAGSCSCASATKSCWPTGPTYQCTLPDGVIPSVRALFPEGSTPDPSLLGNLGDIKLYFPQQSMVNFTFVDEGAGYRNQFGYFMYNQTDPTKPGFVQSENVVFPDVSFPSTGCLQRGVTVGRGPVSGGLWMGFWTIADGYNGGKDKWVSFQDGATLKNSDGKNHTGWVYLSELNTTLFGFEDLNGLGDKDYNDVMFTIATDTIIDLSRVPRYEGGLIQQCRQGVIAQQDYLEYKCMQWALMSAPSGATCNSFLSVPSGWTLAYNDTDTLEMIMNAGNTFTRTLGSTGCMAVTIALGTPSSPHQSTAYTTTGAPCSAPMTPFNTNSQSCFNVPCASRILIKGRRISSCTGSDFQYCAPNVAMSIINQSPSSLPLYGDANYASTSVWPTSYNLYTTPGGSINLNISTIIKSARNFQGGVATDIYFLLDTYNAYSKDLEYLSKNLVNFANTLTDPNSIDFDIPNLGFGSFRPSDSGIQYSNNCPLNPDVLTVADCISKVSTSGWTRGSTAQNAFLAASTVMSALDGQFRSFAYKMIVVISDNPQNAYATLARSEIQYNVVPIFYNPNPTVAALNTYLGPIASLPLSGRKTGLALKSEKDWGNARLQNWHQQIPTFIKSVVLNITLARMHTGTQANTFANGFIGSIAAPYNVFALPANSQYGVFDRPVTITFPSDRTVADLGSQPFRTVVTVLGFGTTDFNLFANRPPVAIDTPVFTDEDVSINFTMAPTDADGNRLKIAFLSNNNPGAGVLSTMVGPYVSVAGPVDYAGNTWYEGMNFRFVPTANWNGEVRYNYIVNDGCMNSTIRALIITVRPVNDPPTATDFSISCPMNEAALSNSALVNFVGKISDIDNDVATLSITIVTVPPSALGFLYDGATRITSGGYVLGTGRTLTFVPNAYKFSTNERFQYRVSDGSLTADAFVTVIVVERNFNPVLSVAPSTLTSGAGNTTQFTISVFDGDAFVTSDTAVIEVVGQKLTTGNTIKLLASGTTISSATTASTASPFAWSAPIAVPSATATLTLIAEWTADASTVGQNITLRAMDRFGNYSNEVLVSFIVSGNRPPIIMFHPATVTTAEDTPLSEIRLSATDLDFVGVVGEEEWKDLKIQFTSLPSSGSLNLVRRASPVVNTPITLNSEYMIGNGTTDAALLLSQYNVTYTPNADFNGVDSFTYVFIDRLNGISNPETTEITVTAVNDRPTTSDLTLQMNEWTDPNLPVSTTIDEFSAFDSDGNPLTLELTSVPAKGFLKYNGIPVHVNTSSSMPFNVGSDWSFTYEPPFLEYSIPDGSVFASFTFRVCDNSGSSNNCSVDATVSLIVNFINTLPTSNDITVRTPSNTPISFDILIADLDVLRDPDTARYAVFTAMAPSNKGTFYLCAAMDSSCTVTIDTLNQPIRHPRRIWYMPENNDFSTSGPSAIVNFQVGDSSVLNTGVTYTISVFVDFLNQPPEWRADTAYTIDEDTSLTLFTLASNSWYDDLLRVPENQANPPPYPVVTFEVVSLPSRGVLSLCRASNVSSGCTPVTQADLPATSDDSLGRILFTPEQDCWGQNYTSFQIRLTDSGFPYGPKMTTNVTIYVHVVAVNDPPIFEAVDFHTIDSNMNGPVLNEDTSAVLTWRLRDVDSTPDQLITKIKTSSFSRGLWSVKRCYDDGFAGFEACPEQAQMFLTNKTELFSVQLLRSESTTCNTVPGFPTTDFSGCWAEFKVVFAPEPGRFQIPYTQWTFSGFDGEDTGIPATALISVLPVNDPPTITAPARVVGTAGSAEMPIKDDSGVVIVVADSDANPRSTIEKFKIEILEGEGDFIPAERLICEWVQTTVPTWECYNNLNNLNKYLALSKFKIDTNFGEEALVRWTIDDLGNTSPEGAPVPLNASTTTRFVFTKLPAIIPNQPGNYLSITAIIGALGGLLLIALVAWRLKKSLAAPDDTYFEMGVTSISAAPTSPLYKAQFKESFNPAYKPTDV